MFRHKIFLNTDMRKEGAFYSTVVFEYYYIQALNDCLSKTKTEQVFRLLRLVLIPVIVLQTAVTDVLFSTH